MTAASWSDKLEKALVLWFMVTGGLAIVISFVLLGLAILIGLTWPIWLIVILFGGL